MPIGGLCHIYVIREMRCPLSAGFWLIVERLDILQLAELKDLKDVGVFFLIAQIKHPDYSNCEML